MSARPKSPAVDRALSWIGRLGAFSGVSMITSGVMFLTGIVVVRNMDPEEYAWYTVVTSMVGGLNILSTLGVNSGVMSMGGQRLGNRTEMGQLVATAKRYRWIFAALTAPFVLAITAYLLISVDCPPGYTALLCALMGATLVVQINTSIATGLVALAGRFNYTATVTLFSMLVRLVGVVLLIWLLFISSTVLLVSSLVTLATYLFFFRPASTRYYDETQKENPDFGKGFRNVAINSLPNCLAGFFMPQITLILIANFGNTEAVAGLGAISRIAMIYLVPKTINKAILSPLLARTTGNASLKRRFWITCAFNGGLALVAYSACVMFSDLLILVLGENYLHLERELVFFLLITSLAFFFEGLNSIVRAKAWLRWAWINPVGNICTQIMVIPLVDLSTLMGVLQLRLAGTLYSGAWTIFIIARGFAGKASVVGEAGEAPDPGTSGDDERKS